MATFSILAKLGLDTSTFDSKFGGAISGVKGRIAAAFGVGAIALYTKKAIENASAINDQSAALRVSTKFFQEVQYASKQAGIEMGTFEGILKRMQVSQANAILNPSGAEANAFAALGISLKELSGLNPEQLFVRLESASAKAGVSAQVLTQIFGRSGLEILKLGGNFQEMAKEAESAGAIIKQDVLDTLDDLGDSVDRLKSIFESTFARVLVNALDRASKILDGMIAGTKAVGAFFGGLTSLDTRDGKAGTNWGEKALELGIKAFEDSLVESAAEAMAREDAIKESRARKRDARDRAAAVAPDVFSASSAPALQLQSIRPDLTSLQRIGAQVSESNTLAAIQIARQQFTEQREMKKGINELVWKTSTVEDAP